jgi:hypothetical protein
VRDLNLVFREAHAYGTRALRSGDLKKFGETVAVERSLIDEQRDAIEKQRDLIKQQRAVIERASVQKRSKRKKPIDR